MASSLVLYKRLVAYAMPYWKGFVIAILAMMITAATEAAFPALMKPLLDKGFSGPRNLEIWKVPLFILLIFMLRGLSGFVGSYVMAWVSQSTLRDLRKELFNKLVHLPVTSIERRSAGSLLGTLTHEVFGLATVATEVTTVLVRDSLILIGLLLWLFYLNWQLALIIFLTAPLFFILTKAFSRKIRKASHAWLDSHRDLIHDFEQAISGNKAIKIYNENNTFEQNFAQKALALHKKLLRTIAVELTQTPASQLLASMVVAAVLSFALYQSKQNAMTVGEFVSFVTAMLMTLSPMKHLAQVNGLLQRALANAENIFIFLDEVPEHNAGQVQIKRAQGNLTFEHVTYQYKGRDAPAIRDITLTIKAGQTCAFVGGSGGGKTTLLNLVPRFLDPTAGSVRLDDIDLREYSLESLRAQISIVTQEVNLFNDTVFYNLTYGMTLLPDSDRISAVLKECCLDEFVEQLPQKLDTRVGAHGIELSGGQRQRILIARAMLKDAPILLLDEATSALDNESEAMIQQFLHRRLSQQTVLVVAHRLSTVTGADIIYVLDKGRVVESGNHETLLALNGRYSVLWHRGRL